MFLLVKSLLSESEGKKTKDIPFVSTSELIQLEPNVNSINMYSVTAQED